MARGLANPKNILTRTLLASVVGVNICLGVPLGMPTIVNKAKATLKGQ